MEASTTCLKFVEDKKTFEDAQHSCHALAAGVKLAEPRHSDDNEIIKSMIGTNTQAWIGGADNSFGDGTEGTFVWLSDKSEVAWTDWYSGQPNNYDGKQHCMAYYKNQWNDDKCDLLRPFVCETGNANGSRKTK